MTADWPRPSEGIYPSDGVRRDAEAAVAARRELGPEYDDHVAAGLADRVEELVALRTAELRHTREQGSTVERAEATSQRQRFVLAIISLGIGIPVTAISGALVEPSLFGMAVGWAGIVGVNVASALTGSRRDRRP